MSTYLFHLAFDGGRYLITAGLAFLALVIWGKRWLHRRVRPEPHDRGQLRREIGYSVITAMIFAGVGTAMAFGSRAGIFKVYLVEDNWLYFAFTVVLLI